MNRRDLLKSIVGIGIAVTPFSAGVPSVVHFTLNRQKYHDISSGAYRADTVEMVLSNGSIIESWLDQQGMLNTGGRVGNDEDFEVDFKVAEEYAPLILL